MSPGVGRLARSNCGWPRWAAVAAHGQAGGAERFGGGPRNNIRGVKNGDSRRWVLCLANSS
jgi:hypothetical protein